MNEKESKGKRGLNASRRHSPKQGGKPNLSDKKSGRAGTLETHPLNPSGRRPDGAVGPNYASPLSSKEYKPTRNRRNNRSRAQTGGIQRDRSKRDRSKSERNNKDLKE